MTTLPASRTPTYARALLVVYGILLAVALFSPTSTVQSSLVYDVSRLLHQLGAPWQWVTFKRMEVVMNAVIVAPVPFLCVLIFRRLRWQDCVAYAFVGSALVELFQGVALPHRHASFSDIVANTCGGLLGAALGVLVRRVMVRRGVGGDRR